jgi:hypothetical protein
MLSIWFAADREAWRAFENNNGPVRAMSPASQMGPPWAELRQQYGTT